MLDPIRNVFQEDTLEQQRISPHSYCPSDWYSSPISGNGVSPVHGGFAAIDGDQGSNMHAPDGYYPDPSFIDSANYDSLHPSQEEAGLLHIAAPLPTSAYRLETFFFQRFINSVWLHSQAEAWKYYLPGVLNQSPCLYYSVMGLSALYMYKTGVDPRAKNLALSSYHITLSHLQNALYDPKLALEDTTLMATVIIGLYELVDKPGHLSWCSHSRGTAELMKLRGPAVANSGVFRMLFLTFRGFEVMRAILQLDETFMAEKAWTVHSSSTQTLLSSAGELVDCAGMTNEPDADGTKPDYAAVLFMLGGQVANLQAACSRLARNGQLTANASQELVDQAKALEASLHKWRHNLPQSYDGRKRPSVVPGSPYSTIHEFENMQMGYQLCFYSAFLLLIHRTIAKYILKDVRLIPATDQEFARFILQTAEFLTQGLTTASLHATWPIYMACISLRDECERKWTVTLLEVIVQDKGWGVAHAALYAANVIARKNQIRAIQENQE